VASLSYDAQGNLAGKNGQSYDFDFGNRLKNVPGKEWYQYDGLGRRVKTGKADGKVILWLYNQSGQMLYDEDGTTLLASEHVYLAGSLIATRARNWSTNVSQTKYQHTDALGSPVAVTNEAGTVIERNDYEPYGAIIGKPNKSGIGYTGHVMDGDTGLTYMQQRYYDQSIGRFLSVDPVMANSGSGANFNRYWYGNNNPYKFTDPDGRAVQLSGSDADQRTLIQQTERFTGMRVTQDSNGMMQSNQCTIDQSSASPVAAGALMSAINSSDTISLTAVNADPGVLGDQYISGKVDVADINGLASQSPQMGAATLTHILTEYQTAQGMPGGQVMSNFPAAHQTALSVESQVFGAANRTNSVSRFSLAPGTNISFDYINSDGTANQSFNYTLDQNLTPR